MKHKILVIDDEEAVRNSFLLALEDSDYEVTAAPSGEEGIKEFRIGDFKLVFLDLKMPGLSGIETLHELRKINPKIKIYFITAYTKEYLKMLGHVVDEKIQFEIITKPLGAEQILTAVINCLDNPSILGDTEP